MEQFLKNLKLLFEQLWHNLLPVLATIGTFIQPIQFILLAVGMFIALDTIIARVRVYLQKKKNKAKLAQGKRLTKLEKEKGEWTSRKFQVGFLPKSILYCLAVFAFYLLDYGLMNEFVKLFTSIDYFLTKIVAIVLIYIETLSINESFKKIKGKGIPEYFFDLIKNVNKVREKLGEINPGKKDDDDDESDSEK